MKKINKMSYSLVLNGNEYTVVITKKKIKRLIIKVNYKDEIMVSAPLSVSYSDALNKVFLNTDWIENQINKHKKINAELSINDYYNKKIIYLFGKKYILYSDSTINKPYLIMNDNIFYKNQLNNAINLIYQENYKIIEDIFNKNLDLFKNKVKQNPIMQLRKMKSRWGSCNYNTGKIILNKMLVCLPLELINYVIIHEFTHLIYPNHSLEYYNYLKKIIPNYKNIEKKLKKYAFLLIN